MLIGYARVSTADQDLSLQKEALKAAGCQKIYEDQATGTRIERLGLNQALDQLRKGDTLVVWKLDRLGRSVKGLIDFVTNIEKNEVHFKSLTEQIDTGTPAGRFFFHMMASLAEMERGLLVERTQAGLKAARQRGKVGGRRRLMTESKAESARKLLCNGSPPREVARSLGVSIPTLYRWVPASSCFSNP